MDEQLPIIEFAFPGQLRDSLIAAIQSGTKTSTSSLLREYEIDEEALPVVGGRGVVVDSNGERVFVLETTAVDVVRLCDVPLQHALDEGEGFTRLSEWRAEHMRYWRTSEMRDELGEDFNLDDDSLIVLERFRLVV